jgi:predicted TIM-barrel fold metal-dependent hydrolase
MAKSAERGFFDCDTHCYEPRDAAIRYLPREYLDRAIVTVKNAKGDDMVLAGHRLATFNSEVNVGFDYAYRPGSLKELLKKMASGGGGQPYEPEPMRPEYLEREPRLKVLEEQGVARSVLFPGALALSAEHYVTDTEALYATLSAYNRWFDETWGFNYQDQIYATALLSLRDLDRAVALTDEILARGAKVVLLPTGPAYGRSPGDPYFDPIYARLAEAGVVLALHIMPNWYFEAISPAWGHDPDPGSWHMSAWQWMNTYGERPAVETISSLIFDNLFGRFPQLKVLIAEHGASWLPQTLSHMDKSRGMGRNGPWVGGKLKERPSAIFKRHVRVTPYPEDDVPAIVAGLGGDDSVLVFGSDFPHASGVAAPRDFEDGLGSLSDDAKRRVMRDNAWEFFDARQ